MVFGIKIEGWLTIAAIVIGPLLAFAIQNWRDKRREERDRKRQIFQQLLLTLKVPMAPRHVDAINSVPLEYHAHPATIRAWRLYTSHLNNQAMLKNNSQGWGEKKFELLLDLAYEMGRNLHLDHIDKAMLSDNLYVPQGYEDTEQQFQQIRTTLLQVLAGEHAIPMTMVGPVQVEEPLQALQEIATQKLPVLPPPADRR